jgi:hypothetical protein
MGILCSIIASILVNFFVLKVGVPINFLDPGRAVSDGQSMKIQ